MGYLNSPFYASRMLSENLHVPPENSLHLGDCLDFLKRWSEGFVDLVYLDPPFGSSETYHLTPQGKNSLPVKISKVFEDIWKWDESASKRVCAIRSQKDHPAHGVIDGLAGFLSDTATLSYVSYMAVRLAELWRVLKPSGSLYLHCDPTMSHYLKIVLDHIFGVTNFRSEIVWRIGWVSGFKSKKKGWIRNHDIIFHYVKSPAAIKLFNKEYIPYPEGYVRRDGSAPTGQGFPIEDTWNCSEHDKLNSIQITSFSTEKLGFPTQKPVRLLERIVKASSPCGGLVLDPCMGSGTTLQAAHSLGRKWVGIDISPLAVESTLSRGFARHEALPNVDIGV